MPQHEVGYRRWTGEHTSQASRWWIIAETGFQSAFKSRWVRRILFVAWLPIFYWGTIFFVVENVLVPGTSESNSEAVSQSDQEGMPLIGPEEFRILESLQDELGGDEIDFEELEALPPEERAEYMEKQIRRRVEDIQERAQSGTLEMSEGVTEEMLESARVRALKDRFDWVAGSDKLVEALASDDKNEQRHVAWSLLLMTFFRYPQATMIIFLLGFISPGLISRDLRSRAYLIYFSKPIGRIEYIMGKIAIPAVFLLLVTTIPALCLYVLGVSLSPDLSVVAITWDIPLRIILASIVLIVPTACLSLMLSSLTHESRFATFAWFAVWILGHGAWLAILVMQAVRTDANSMTQVLNDPIVSGWSSLSLYNNLGNVQSWIFGLSDFSTALPGLIVLSVLSVCSVFIMFRRVSAPIRV